MITQLEEDLQPELEDLKLEAPAEPGGRRRRRRWLLEEDA